MTQAQKERLQADIAANNELLTTTGQAVTSFAAQFQNFAEQQKQTNQANADTIATLKAKIDQNNAVPDDIGDDLASFEAQIAHAKTITEPLDAALAALKDAGAALTSAPPLSVPASDAPTAEPPTSAPANAPANAPVNVPGNASSADETASAPAVAAAATSEDSAAAPPTSAPVPVAVPDGSFQATITPTPAPSDAAPAPADAPPSSGS